MYTASAEIPRTRALRDLAVVLMMSGLVLGSLFWRDDAWPFAPFRMFARGTTTDVHVLALEADLAGGQTVRLDYERLNLRRAEVEGQILRFTARPSMLGDLMAAYNRTASPASKITSLRLLSRRAPIVDGRLVPGDSKSRSGRPGPPPGIRWNVKVIAQWPPR